MICLLVLIFYYVPAGMVGGEITTFEKTNKRHKSNEEVRKLKQQENAFGSVMGL